MNRAVSSLGNFFLLSILVFGVSRPGLADPPATLVSIPPLAGIARYISDDKIEPYILLRAGQSPHGYSLRPEDARALRRAELIFWVGPELENFLSRRLETHKGSVALMPRLGNLLEARGEHSHAHHHDDGHEEEHEDHEKHDGHSHADHDESHEGEHEDHEEHGEHSHADHDDGHKGKHEDTHEEGHFDAHIWMGIEQALSVADIMRAEFSLRDPSNRELYASRAALFEQELRKNSAEWQQILAPLRSKRFLVHHDVWQYFEASFGLKPVFVLLGNPELPPSPEQVREINRMLSSSDTVLHRCMVSEPQFSQRLPDLLAERYKLRLISADVLGYETPMDKNHYFAMIDSLVQGLSSCRF